LATELCGPICKGRLVKENYFDFSGDELISGKRDEDSFHINNKV
jgi:hypothetical protein